MMLIQIAFLFAAALVAAAPAVAEPSHQWRVRHEESSLTFALDVGGAPMSGAFEIWSADIVYDPADPAAALVSIVVDTASVTIDDARAASTIGNAAWLAVAAHPQATFSGAGFIANASQDLEMRGTLALRGIERPIRLTGDLTVHEGVAIARFATTLARKTFGVGDDTPAVAAEIVVTATVIADRGPAKLTRSAP